MTNELYHSSVLDLADKIPSSSIDAIITDPPYGAEDSNHFQCYMDLAQFASHALKPNGRMLVMAGSAYMYEYKEKLDAGCDNGLSYLNTIIYATLQGSPAMSWHTNHLRRYKPIFYYVKPDTDLRLFEDVMLASKVDHRNQFHKWEQTQTDFYRLVKQFTDKNDVVCDPFVGGGTTAAACNRLERRFIGADIELDCVETTLKRIENPVYQLDMVDW